MVDILDYALKGDDLKIWFADRGFLGEDGRTYSGAWHFSGGGGYEVTGIRVEGA